MNTKTVIGLLLGFCVGLVCAWLEIPAPAPPVLVGALLVVAMTSGYVFTDKYLASHKPKHREGDCGGPTGGH